MPHFIQRFSYSRVSWLIFAVAVLVRFPFIVSRDIALDEPFSIFHAQRSIADIFALMKEENNPPLHFMILHFVTALFGNGPLAVRLPSLLFGALAAVMIRKAGKKFLSPEAGFAASFLFIFSTHNIYFAQEARGYSLFMLLSVSVFYQFFSLMQEGVTRGRFMKFLFLNVLLIYTHYLGLVLIVLQVIFLAATRRKELIRELAVSYQLLFLAFVPLLYFFFVRVSSVSDTGTWVSVPSADALYDNIRKFSNAPVVAACFIVLLAAGMIALFRKGSVIQRYIFAWFFVPYLGLYLISFIFPVYIDRYLNFLSAPFYLSLSMIPGLLVRKENLRHILYVLMVAGMAVTVKLNPSHNREPAKAAAILKSMKDDHTLLLIAPAWDHLGIYYYYDREAFSRPYLLGPHQESKKIVPVYKTGDALKALDNHVGPVVYLQGAAMVNNPSDELMIFLKSRYRITHRGEVKGFVLTRFR